MIKMLFVPGYTAEYNEYSDPAIGHLPLAFVYLTGQEMQAVIQERIFARLGIENASWDVQCGSGFLGPHTDAQTFDLGLFRNCCGGLPW